MSTHWRLAAGGAVSAVSVFLPSTAAVGYAFGGVYAAALLYGAVVGVVCFTSIAVTVALLGGRSVGEKLPLVMGVYLGRLVFMFVGIGVPIALESWPVLAMLCGLVGVYVVENVMILVGAWKVQGTLRASKKETGGYEVRAQGAKFYVGFQEGG